MHIPTNKLLTAAAVVLLGLGTLAWAVWMLRRYWRDDDPGAKHRRTETIMMRPYVIGFVGAAIMPLLTLVVLLDLGKNKMNLYDLFWLLGNGLVVSVLLVCYAARQIIIYDYDRLRHRPAFGKMRTYDYSEVRSMTPIVFDLLVHVGKRWILIDAMQDWHPLWEKYRFWRMKNGLPVKKREYKTALGRAFGQIPGGIGIILGITAFLSLGALFTLFLAWMCWRDGEVAAMVVSLLFFLLGAVGLFLILFSAANQEKYPRLAKIMIPNLIVQGQAKKAEKKSEKTTDE